MLYHSQSRYYDLLQNLQHTDMEFMLTQSRNPWFWRFWKAEFQSICRRKVEIRADLPKFRRTKFSFQLNCCCRKTLFWRNLYLQQPRKKGPMSLHFQDKFPTFAGDILNYGSVTLFSCGERRKFKHNRENKWHCPLVVSSRYRRGVVAYFIYWVSYDLSH